MHTHSTEVLPDKQARPMTREEIAAAINLHNLHVELWNAPRNGKHRISQMGRPILLATWGAQRKVAIKMPGGRLAILVTTGWQLWASQGRFQRRPLEAEQVHHGTLVDVEWSAAI